MQFFIKLCDLLKQYIYLDKMIKKSTHVDLDNLNKYL